MDSIKIIALLKSIEYGSLTKAADELGYTQAGLTHMMNRLEKEIGLTLLQRTKSGVRLTTDGRTLLPLLKNFAEADIELKTSIENIRNRDDKIIKIGAYSSVASHWIPVIINEFQKKYPNTKFEIHVGDLDDIPSMIMNSELDLAFVSKQESLKGDWIHLANDPFYAVLPPETKIDTEEVSVDFFDDKQFFIPTYGADYDVLRFLKSSDVKPLINPTAADDATIVSMVCYGLGYSILPKLILTGTGKNIVTKPISPAEYRELGIMVKSKNTLSLVVTDFIKCAKKVVAMLNKQV
ncbi:MAG: LysR family transcriptional regulator [Ruminococcus sp.]|nr:LysR family transcriptional regulator [Candidatus Copronaster equi]